MRGEFFILCLSYSKHKTVNAVLRYLKLVCARNELETSVGRLDKKKGEIDLFGHQGLFRSQ